MKDKPEQQKSQTGFTEIPNDYLEAKARTKISAIGNQVLDVIERKTFGWHKEHDGISRRQFKEITRIESNGNILYGIKQLGWQHIITFKTKQGVRTVYKIQKDYTKWRDWNFSKYRKLNLPINTRQVTQEKHLPINTRQVDKLEGKGSNLPINHMAGRLPINTGQVVAHKSHGNPSSKETNKETISKERKTELKKTLSLSPNEKDKDKKKEIKSIVGDLGYNFDIKQGTKRKKKTKLPKECGEHAFEKAGR